MASAPGFSPATCLALGYFSKTNLSLLLPTSNCLSCFPLLVEQVQLFSPPRFMSFTIYASHSTVFIKCLPSDSLGHTKINRTKVLPPTDLQSGRNDRQSKGYSAVWQVSDRSRAKWVNLAWTFLCSYIFYSFPPHTPAKPDQFTFAKCYLHVGLHSNVWNAIPHAYWNPSRANFQYLLSGIEFLITRIHQIYLYSPIKLLKAFFLIVCLKISSSLCPTTVPWTGQAANKLLYW